jgi:hypothetical protein
MVGTPVDAKSPTLRMTTVKPCTQAVAAIKASRSLRRLGTCKPAQRRATARSMGKIRSANSGNTCCCSQARSKVAWPGSLRAKLKTPGDGVRETGSGLASPHGFRRWVRPGQLRQRASQAWFENDELFKRPSGFECVFRPKTGAQHKDAKPDLVVAFAVV